MAEIKAIAVTSITGMMVTDDGNHMLLRVSQADGQELVVALPQDQLLSVVDMAALAQEQCQKIQREDSSNRGVFQTSWWELGQDIESGAVILSLKFGAGGRLHFSLPGPMPSAIYETMGVMLGLLPQSANKGPLA